ncbi:reverse transcriptase [Trichonephila clavipes]|nr:reverse transcriptase [Trichonephila clavipes]
MVFSPSILMLRPALNIGHIYAIRWEKRLNTPAITQTNKSLGKSWETMDTVGPIPRHMERAKAVHFHLTTGRNFLGVYFPWLGLAADKACPLCGHATMDSDHLLQCTRLDEYQTDDVVRRNREALRQMVKKPSTSLG